MPMLVGQILRTNAVAQRLGDRTQEGHLLPEGLDFRLWKKRGRHDGRRLLLHRV